MPRIRVVLSQIDQMPQLVVNIVKRWKNLLHFLWYKSDTFTKIGFALMVSTNTRKSFLQSYRDHRNFSDFDLFSLKFSSVKKNIWNPYPLFAGSWEAAVNVKMPVNINIRWTVPLKWNIRLIFKTMQFWQSKIAIYFPQLPTVQCIVYLPQ